MDNSLFIHPLHEIMINTEFAVQKLFKLLPFIFTISFSVLAIIFMEFLPESVTRFKLSRLGYNIFGFFNQRFLVEFFYNKYITGLILDLGAQTTRVLDKGSVEAIGPVGMQRLLMQISKFIVGNNLGIVTIYAIYIVIGFVSILTFVYLNLSFVNLVLLLILIFGNNYLSSNFNKAV